MAVTLAQFRSAFPELSKADDTVVQESLDQATRNVNAEIFAELADDAIKYLAAHLISTKPGGVAARLDVKMIKASGAKEFASSTYGLRYHQLKSSIAVGPITIV